MNVASEARFHFLSFQTSCRRLSPTSVATEVIPLKANVDDDIDIDVDADVDAVVDAVVAKSSLITKLVRKLRCHFQRSWQS